MRSIGETCRTAAKLIGTGNRIGLFQLMLYGLSIPALPLDMLLGGLLNLWNPKSSRRPLVFITGYSRSGTTLLYQACARFWDVEYLNNLVVPFPRSYPLASAAYRALSSARTSGFTSFYGRTMGLYGTNDAPELFGPWLDYDALGRGQAMGEDCLARLQGFAARHEVLLGKPLLVKNCNAYHRFGQILESMPGAWGIFVKRRPENVIDSTLRARAFVKGSADAEWEYSEERRRRGPGAALDPVEEICRNLRHAYDILDGLAAGPLGARLRVVGYEDLCARPAEHVVDLGREILGQELDLEAVRRAMPPFTADLRLGSPPEVCEHILARVAEHFPTD